MNILSIIHVNGNIGTNEIVEFIIWVERSVL